MPDLQSNYMKRRGAIFSLQIAVWVLAICACMFVLMQYDNTPGITATKARWPANSQISLSQDCPTLIMFAHPQCPCTKASITELGELIASCKTKFKAYVLLFHPQNTPAQWDKNALWQEATSIAGITVLNDIEGIEAKKFHSITSGQTMIYSPKGQLIFSGGLTNARGQVGNNSNLHSAKLALLNCPLTVAQVPVFGCSIFRDSCTLISKKK